VGWLEEASRFTANKSGFCAILDSKDVCGDLVHIEYIVFRGDAFYLENEHFTVSRANYVL
jgi:hypothetical protein